MDYIPTGASECPGAARLSSQRQLAGDAMMRQDFINLGITFFGAGVGWMLKTLWEAVKALQSEIKDMERELHTQYISKDDYRQDLAEIKDMLKQIFDKIEKKADK
jgi:hypothetical protein